MVEALKGGIISALEGVKNHRKNNLSGKPEKETHGHRTLKVSEKKFMLPTSGGKLGLTILRAN